MSDDNLTPEQQAILQAAHAAPNPYAPPAAPIDAPPRPQPRPAPDPKAYRPWLRPLTYVVFLLGTGAATWAIFCVTPLAFVYGWFALGMGIPAVLLAKKEIGRFPQAAGHGFIKWGLRTGIIGLIVGPIGGIIWIVLIFALEMRF